jgi:hypothetical protein
LGVIGASVWSLGCFYWAYAMSIGGSQRVMVMLVVALGVLPLVMLYFYGLSYVVRLSQNGNDIVLTLLGLIRSRDLRIPVSAISDVSKPEAGGVVIRVAGRPLPLMVDLQAEHIDLDGIARLRRDAGARQ